MLENGKLILIDFDRFDFGDPWEEFNRIVWCAQAAPPFAAGMIDGYFDANPPENFWRCLTFYIGSNTLSSIYWAIDYGQGEMEIMLKQAQDVLSWYDNMQTVVPSMYPSVPRIKYKPTKGEWYIGVSKRSANHALRFDTPDSFLSLVSQPILLKTYFFFPLNSLKFSFKRGKAFFRRL